jgi:hypothetical protein
MAITLEIDQQGLVQASRWSQAVAKQLPFATSVALNDVAFKARGSLNGATRQYFQGPVKFTQTAFLVEKAKKATLTAYVFANNQQGRNRARYLRYGIQGGQRVAKGFERYFAGADNDGTLPPGTALVPTSLVKTTDAGNVSLATLRSISKGLSTTNKRGGFFVGTPRGAGDRPPGIYRRSREQLFPYFIAASAAPRYTGRFPIQDIGEKIVARNFNDALSAALDKAMATAR